MSFYETVAASFVGCALAIVFLISSVAVYIEVSYRYSKWRKFRRSFWHA